ncbi:hypothetical protein R5R35_003263 [Gryllus longicercus]|uniref:Uncharacterized protein n=1 Tax=Gryllus longicercus TaxID=2509291 RepID=A0AAN9VLX0_9ORTH
MVRFPRFSLAVAAVAMLLAPRLAAAAPNKLPPGFKLCPRKDSNTIKCLEEALDIAIRELEPGLPEFGIPSLDPFNIPQLAIGDLNSDAPVNLKINFSDINIYNLKTGKTSNVKFDPDAFLLSAHEQAGEVYAEANYVMDGRILLIPAKGEGRVTLNITNLQVDLGMKCDKQMKKNKVHLKITEFHFELTNIDSLIMHFDNLFNGDKTLGATINALVNENWMEVWSQLKVPLEQIGTHSFKEYGRRIFDRVPMDDIFLP